MTSQHPALGIDYGEARIGIAATDPVGIMAHPVETIHRRQTDAVTRIVQIVQERGIRTLVLGLPVRMDGTEGSAAVKVRAFGRELSAALPGLPLIFMDECLTTVIAQEKLHAAGKKTKSFRPVIDQSRASLLQLLVADCADFLPFKSGNDLMLSLSAFVTITPAE